MRGSERIDAEEKRERIMAATRGACAACGAPALYLAHRIPKRKSYLRKYGPTVVHSALNLVPCCTRPECNDCWDIQNHPVLQGKLVTLIEGFNGREPTVDAIRQIISWFREQKKSMSESRIARHPSSKSGPWPVRHPYRTSEPKDERQPGAASEPKRGRHPLSRSGPDIERHPSRKSEPLHARHPSVISEPS